jgi:transcription initiation factor TFIID TATA-box-binding protein
MFSRDRKEVVVLDDDDDDESACKDRKVEVKVVAMIQNVMGTADLGTLVELSRLALTLNNTIYQPTRHAALHIRLRRPDCSVLVYASGKLTCTGCKSDDDCLRALRIVARKIQLIHMSLQPALSPVQFLKFTIHNRSASCDFGFRVQLEGLAHEYPNDASHESELAASCTFRMKNPPLTWLIYASGKSLINHIIHLQSLPLGLTNMHSILAAFRLPSSYSSLSSSSSS